MKRNDPNDNRFYNYLYKITNNINNKVYYGVHRTDNIDDGYMGSGKLVKRSINKHGAENFTKEIIQTFDTYNEALSAEAEIVTDVFIESDQNYNMRTGGHGGGNWNTEARQFLSEKAKMRWKDPEKRAKLLIALRSKERREKLSTNLKNWISNNPQQFKQRQDKINKNPIKIQKTADFHRGRKRSNTTRKKISESVLNSSPSVKKLRSGKGKMYIYNPITYISKRHDPHTQIPDGWIAGSGPKTSLNYKNMNKGSFFGYDPHTMQIKRFQKGKTLPEGWVRGRPKNKNGRSTETYYLQEYRF